MASQTVAAKVTGINVTAIKLIVNQRGDSCRPGGRLTDDRDMGSVNLYARVRYLAGRWAQAQSCSDDQNVPFDCCIF